MKIQIIHCGRIAQSDLLPLVAEYKKRLSAFCKIEDIELKIDPAGRDKRTAQKQQDPIYKPNAGDFVLALDERGKQHTSQEFAAKLQTWTDDPRIKTLVIIIGPPFGFDIASKSVANELWSLSSMTIPSDLAWLLVWEQVYRAHTILKGMPYHHD